LARQLLETAPDAVVIIGPDGVIRFANAQAERLFGYSHDELVGKLVEVLVPDRARRVHPARRASYFASPTARPMGAELELTARRADGSEFPVDIALSSLETRDGILVSAAIRDVTDRQEAEATRARLAAIVQSSLDAIIGKTPGGIVTSWNPAATQMFGWEEPETVGKTIDFLIPPERRDEEVRLLESVVAGERVEPYETERLGKGGDVVPVALSCSPIRSPSGEIVGVSSIYRDIAALKKTEAKFHGLLEAAPDAIIGVNESGVIQLVTAQAERLFGYSRDELLGQPVEVLVPDGAKGVHPGRRSSYFAQPTARPMGAGMELSARRKDGSEFPVDIALSSVETEDGVLVSAAVRDISERIKATEERKQLEAQLRQSRLESIGQLAGGIAHDFNNILAGTMTYTRLVEDQLNETEPAAFSDAKPLLLEDLQQIVRATERAATLTHQLLLFSRKEVVQPEVLDLNAVVNGIDDLLGRTIGEHIRLTMKLRDSIPPIKMDRGHIEQILMNLAVNARDAMPAGGLLLIETSTLTFDEEYSGAFEPVNPGDYVCLAVSDTGAGMTQETADRAFEPFFTTKERGQGTGLGLATVYGIATQVGGHVSIYSEVGIGTTVKVYIPPSAATPEPATEAEATSLDAVRGETILLVEDEQMVREPTARVLAKRGYEVLVAENPEEALDLVGRTEGRIDVLLTDVVMPGMSGKGLSERLRVTRPETTVIFMSGYPYDIIVRQGSVEEGVVLIEKPFTTEALLEKIRTVLDQRAQDRR
jgi:hypothetical protein